MTIKDRLVLYLKSKNISKSEFGRIIGVSSAYITSMRQSIAPEKIKSIALHFPDLNINWLLTGNDSMIRKDSNYNQSITGNNNVQGNNNAIKNQKYSGDSPELLRAQIDELNRILIEKEERLKEKDAQIKEKDAQINKFLTILSNK